MRTLRLTPAQAATIERRSIAERPFEYCGVLLGRFENETGDVEEVLSVINSDRRPHRFSVPDQEWRRARQVAAERELTILALLHSHVQAPARLSPQDRVALEYSKVAWVIASVNEFGGGELAAFKPGSCEQIQLLIDPATTRRSRDQRTDGPGSNAHG